MNDNVLLDAVKKIEGDIDLLMAEIKKKKQAINVLYESMGEQPPYEIEDEARTSRFIRTDQFYGKGFATAAAEYLRMKKQAVSAQEIMENLERGGFDFQWHGDVRLRNVAISLAKNNQVFHKLPNNTFGLLEFYPDIKKKISTKKVMDNEIRAEIESEKIAEDIADEITKAVTKEEPVKKVLIRRTKPADDSTEKESS